MQKITETEGQPPEPSKKGESNMIENKTLLKTKI